MPQPNDAELTRLITASTGTTVEDEEPNTGAPGNAPEPNFDLILEAVAGNAIGNGGGNYRLDLTCIDETLAAPNAAMSVGFDQQFSAADGWNASGTNFIKLQTTPIPVPAGVRGHTFRYTGRLVDAGNNVVSFVDSNRFILV